MKKQLNFLFIILFIIIFAYLLSPDKEYTDRIWVLKGVALAAPYRAAVNEYWQKKQALPGIDDLELEKILVQVNLDLTAVEFIAVGEDGPGTVTVHYSTKDKNSAPAIINNTKIILTPHLSAGKLSWSCKGTMPDIMIPQACSKL
jgi:hypothetical protein